MLYPEIRIIEEDRNLLTIKGSHFSKDAGRILIGEVPYVNGDTEVVELRTVKWSSNEIVALKLLGKFRFFQTIYVNLENATGETTDWGYPLIFR